MSATESNYGERFFEIDRNISIKLNKENALRQYNEMISNSENNENQTFEQWFESGNYDPTDW